MPIKIRAKLRPIVYIEGTAVLMFAVFLWNFWQ